MAPREATNFFHDEYLSIDTEMSMGGGAPLLITPPPPTIPTAAFAFLGGNTVNQEDDMDDPDNENNVHVSQSQEGELTVVEYMDQFSQGNGLSHTNSQHFNETPSNSNNGIIGNSINEDNDTTEDQQEMEIDNVSASQGQQYLPTSTHLAGQVQPQFAVPHTSTYYSNSSVDPLAMDPIEPGENEAWDIATAMFVESVSSTPQNVGSLNAFIDNSCDNNIRNSISPFTSTSDSLNNTPTEVQSSHSFQEPNPSCSRSTIFSPSTSNASIDDDDFTFTLKRQSSFHNSQQGDNLGSVTGSTQSALSNIVTPDSHASSTFYPSNSVINHSSPLPHPINHFNVNPTIPHSSSTGSPEPESCSFGERKSNFYLPQSRSHVFNSSKNYDGDFNLNLNWNNMMDQETSLADASDDDEDSNDCMPHSPSRIVSSNNINLNSTVPELDLTHDSSTTGATDDDLSSTPTTQCQSENQNELLMENIGDKDNHLNDQLILSPIRISRNATRNESVVESSNHTPSLLCDSNFTQNGSQWNPSFKSNAGIDNAHSSSSGVSMNIIESISSEMQYLPNNPPPTFPPPSLLDTNFSFDQHTLPTDLKYFAERGLIVPLLQELKTPHLKSLGTRMLADYAKHSQRRVAVASNRRILDFCCRTMLEPYAVSSCGNGENMGTDWPGREYAVETLRSLTATEESDRYLMGCGGLLKALALVARGGPFVSIARNNLSVDTHSDSDTVPSLIGSSLPISSSRREEKEIPLSTIGLVSGKARLHACIAIMNLSCGKANKIEIASTPEVLEAMRDVMNAPPSKFSPPISSTSGNGSITSSVDVAQEAHLKAVTCIKNLSNADANDTALLGTEGLVEALGRAAANSCSVDKGATACTTNACLALMNLSISKANKHHVFRTKGVMDSLITVITTTSPPISNGEKSNQDNENSKANIEARVKACSALSNLAIGYDNKIPMYAYPGFVDAILHVIDTDVGEARTKACSILWSFAAERKNQVPVVQRGDILPTLVRVAREDHSTEARFKCVAALTLLAESLENAIPILESNGLNPLMNILHEAGPDPTQWKGQTASWCVGFLMNMAQNDSAVPLLNEAGVVEVLAPLLILDHYQSLKAAMAVTFVCRYDEDDITYDLLRKTENVIPKIISLLHNTLSSRGGNGYKYGVFTLRSSVGCISSLASGPEFMKERIATGPVFESLLCVVSDFCVDGGTPGAIVGGGRDDALSATLAVRALQFLTKHLIPSSGSSSLPFGPVMDQKLITALDSFEKCKHHEVIEQTRHLAADAKARIQQSSSVVITEKISYDGSSCGTSVASSTKKALSSTMMESSIVASLAHGCCGLPGLHTGDDEDLNPTQTMDLQYNPDSICSTSNEEVANKINCVEIDDDTYTVRTFLLKDRRSGKRFVVPIDPSGGRLFNSNRIWCYRRGRFCRPDEVPDPNLLWTDELQDAYQIALSSERYSPSLQLSISSNERGSMVTPDNSTFLGGVQ